MNTIFFPPFLIRYNSVQCFILSGVEAKPCFFCLLAPHPRWVSPPCMSGWSGMVQCGGSHVVLGPHYCGVGIGHSLMKVLCCLPRLLLPGGMVGLAVLLSLQGLLAWRHTPLSLLLEGTFSLATCPWLTEDPQIQLWCDPRSLIS